MALTTDKANLVLALALLAAPLPGTDTEVNQAAASTQALTKRSKSFVFTDAGTAATAVADSPQWTADVAGTITGIEIAFPIAITAAASNTATFTLSKHPASAPGTPVTAATNSTNTSDTVLGANAVAFQAYLMSLSATAANLSFVAGDVLSFAMTKQSSGVAVAAATSFANVTIYYTEN